jgi:hypothetical protein
MKVAILPRPEETVKELPTMPASKTKVVLLVTTAICLEILAAIIFDNSDYGGHIIRDVLHKYAPSFANTAASLKV